jgi:hypothetical protein
MRRLAMLLLLLLLLLPPPPPPLPPLLLRGRQLKRGPMLSRLTVHHFVAGGFTTRRCRTRACVLRCISIPPRFGPQSVQTNVICHWQVFLIVEATTI